MLIQLQNVELIQSGLSSQCCYCYTFYWWILGSKSLRWGSMILRKHILNMLLMLVCLNRRWSNSPYNRISYQFIRKTMHMNCRFEQSYLVYRIYETWFSHFSNSREAWQRTPRRCQWYIQSHRVIIHVDMDCFYIQGLANTLAFSLWIFMCINVVYGMFKLYKPC